MAGRRLSRAARWNIGGGESFPRRAARAGRPRRSHSRRVRGLHGVGAGDRGCRGPASCDDRLAAARDVVCPAQDASRLSPCPPESLVPAGRGGHGDYGTRIPLCQRALERRRAAGRMPRCDRRAGGGRRRTARLGERHVLSFHRQATGMTATFDAVFLAQFRNLVLWRRDVRRFRPDPITRERIDALLEVASHAPSVGLSQPWRFVHVDSAERRLAVVKSFTDANERALAGYAGEKQTIYAGLKLAGLKEAPVHLAVFSDDATHTGSGLGQQTMPETLHYSVVAAIQTLWLAARADGIGMGWVSILDPKAVTRVLDVPKSWSLVAYLNLGLPAEEHLDPELER